MASLNLQVLFNGVDRLTGPMKAIIGGSNDLSKSFKKTNADLKSLQDQQRIVDRFKATQSALENTGKKLKEYRTELKQLQTIEKSGAKLTEEQTKKINSLEQGIKRLKATEASSRIELQSHTQALSKAGFSVDQISKGVGRLTTEESALKNKIHLTTMELNKQREELNKNTAAQDKYRKTQAMLQKGSDYAKKGLMVAGIATGAMVVPVKLAIDYESSLADVKKVFNGTDDEFKVINEEILKMSTRLPMAAKDIAAIVASGAQSGIASKELTTFAETAVKMGVAFDISAEQSGQSMAELRTAFRMSQDQVTTLADQINYLGNNTPAAAKGILEIVQRIGPLGEVGGFTASSIAALGATLRGMGIQEEIAATGIKNTMLALVAGESATKSQSNAFKALGLDSAKVAKDMQKDANGTTLKVLKSVARLDKFKQASILAQLFGKESLSAIAPLLTNMEALEKNLGMVGDKSKYAASMEGEYAARAATTANNIQLLKNGLMARGIGIGNDLLPQVNQLVTGIRNVVNSVNVWAEKNPALAATLTKIAVGGIVVLGAISAISLGILSFIGPLAMLKLSLATLGGGAGIAAGALKLIISPLKMIGLAFLATGRMMLANPMILAITAVVAVIAGAGYLIYKNWDKISSFITQSWSTISGIFSNGFNNITNYISSGFNRAWNGVKGAFSAGINFIKGVIQSVDSVFANNPILTFLFPFIGIPRLIIANWSTISATLSNVWSSITGSISSGVNAAIEIISGWINTATGYISSGFNSIATLVGSVWTTITQTISEGISIASGYISSGFNAISNIASSIWNTISQIIGNAWRSVCNIFLTYTPLGFIVRNFDSVLLFLGGVATRMQSIGRNIIDGLVTGITSGFDKLKGVWASINNYMPDFMKKKMDIHSPSRVMAGMGGHIIDGISVGINKQTPGLKNEFNKSLGVFESRPPLPSTPTFKRRIINDIEMTETPVSSRTGTADRSQEAPKFHRVAAINNPRNITITNSDNITIHIGSNGNGPLSNAANEVRNALAERDRKRISDMRRMLLDSE